MKKKIGIGSLSLLLSVLGLLWSSNLKWFGGFCLGDYVLGLLGLPAWSGGTMGFHYTVLYSLMLLIPAFIIGVKWKNDLFATAGKYISGVVGGCIIVIGATMTIF